MVGEQNRNAAILKPFDDVLNAVNRDRIDASEGFVEQDDLRVAREGTSNFQAATFTSGQ